MTDERKEYLGLRLKDMAFELQEIADEWRADTGNKYVCVEISGNSDDMTHIGLSLAQYSNAHLHEENADGVRRMVAIAGHKDDADNDISKIFFYDRDDIVRKEDEKNE